MGKFKPHKGLKKRVKVTATGKVIRNKAGRRHLMSVKSSKRRRGLREKAGVASTELRRVKTLLGER